MASTLSLLVLVLCASQMNCLSVLLDIDIQKVDIIYSTVPVKYSIETITSVTQGPLDKISDLIKTVTDLGDKECAKALQEKLTEIQCTLAPKILECGTKELESIKSSLESIAKSIDEAIAGIKNNDLAPVAAAIATITKTVPDLSTKVTTVTTTVNRCVATVVGNTVLNLPKEVATCIIQ